MLYIRPPIVSRNNGKAIYMLNVNQISILTEDNAAPGASHCHLLSSSCSQIAIEETAEFSGETYSLCGKVTKKHCLVTVGKSKTGSVWYCYSSLLQGELSLNRRC